MELTHLIGNALAINICLVIVSLLSRKMANKLDGEREGERKERKTDRGGDVGENRHLRVARCSFQPVVRTRLPVSSLLI